MVLFRAQACEAAPLVLVACTSSAFSEQMELITCTCHAAKSWVQPDPSPLRVSTVIKTPSWPLDSGPAKQC